MTEAKTNARQGARSMRVAAVAIALSTFGASDVSAACVAGAQDCPIVIHMARGTDTITLEGRTVQNADCCAYSFRARKGQTFHWNVDGATVRVIITDPAGQSDGPGLPNAIPLTLTGTYIFAVHPNLMAEGAFGAFRLTITIK
jgi:hypothetical protein